MLKSLSIVNYALIDNLVVEFEPGFTAITGETGAGKSIILGALSLILGARADLGALKDKDKKCIIEGEFDSRNLDLKNFFSDNDLDYDDNTIIRRELLPGGKSRAFINDTPVNLKLIQYLGNIFVNIHSQHQTLQLTDMNFQLKVLDDFAVNSELISKYIGIYSNYNELHSKLGSLLEINENSARDEDYFRYQYDELDKAGLNIEKFNELEEKSKILEHSEEIKRALTEAEYIINESENSLLSNHSALLRVLGNITNYLPGAGELTQRLNSLLIELEDIGVEINRINSYEDFNPDELQEISEKLDLVYDLFKKHHVATVEELIEIRNDFERKLHTIQGVDDEIILVKEQLNNIERDLTQLSEILNEQRVDGSLKFAKQVENTITQLGMKDARFEVKVEKTNNFTNLGKNKVIFMFSANPGSPLGEISKIASGGELSRLMLAIKSLINKQQMLPTIIFDEIDSGVSGDIAGKVGNIIKKMSDIHQVISITHLPQIASKADHHFRVYKISTGNSTSTTIDKLDQNSRVEELAAMLSSEKITKKALDVAKEMMDQ